VNGVCKIWLCQFCEGKNLSPYNGDNIMPTQSITNNNGINSMTPVEPVNQSTAPVTAKEFKTKINEYLAEGIKNNLSQDYVARQIESLAKENPDLASKAGLTDYQSIKNGVDQAYQAGAGNRPLALGSASDVDLFQLGVRIDADRRIQPKPMTAGDKAVTKSVGHEVMIGATIATGAAGAPIALSVAKAAWQALMGAAASASASPWAKWMLLASILQVVAVAVIPVLRNLLKSKGLFTDSQRATIHRFDSRVVLFIQKIRQIAEAHTRSRMISPKYFLKDG